MRIFSYCAAALTLLLALLPLRAQAPADSSLTSVHNAEKIPLPGISNAARVDERLFRGAQPAISSLAELRKLGVSTIVDLRAEGVSKPRREQKQAEALGMRFVRIPVGGFSTPTSAQLAQFFSVLRESPAQKVFVHCEFGDDRTGVFVASYRIAFDHWSADQAVSEMLAFGFNRRWHPDMLKFVRALPERLRSDSNLKSALGESL